MDKKPGPSKKKGKQTDPEKETESKESGEGESGSKPQESAGSGSKPPETLESGSRLLEIREPGSRPSDNLGSGSIRPDSFGSPSLQEWATGPPEVTSQEEAQRSKTRFLHMSSQSMVFSEGPRSPMISVDDMRKPPLAPSSSRGVFSRVAQKLSARSELSREQSLVKKKKKKINPAERKFISPLRAMEEYCLTAEELQGLPTVQRRSPYRSAPRMTVHNRNDVEAKAIQIWGSKEAIEAEFQRRLNEKHAVVLFSSTKKKSRQMRREGIVSTEEKKNKGLCSRSGFVVLSAITVNALNLVFKLVAWLYTSSHSMFSETLHSVADTANQMILAIGIYKSTKTANPDHPYGYTSMRYVSSLISGVGIFCIGSGLSLYHGMVGLLTDTPIEEFFWAYLILLFAVISESMTLLFAIHAIHRDAKKTKMSMFEYVIRGVDPSVNVVLLEDSAAVTGVVVAAVCMAISQHINSGIPDSIGSLLVGVLLGWVAWFIIRSNVSTLIGKSIPYEKIVEINKFIERDSMIRAIYDVKGIDMGNNLVKYKEMKRVRTIEDAELFLLKHGEQIVDRIGEEIDRIEVELRKQYPTIRHCDLEIL